MSQTPLESTLIAIIQDEAKTTRPEAQNGGTVFLTEDGAGPPFCGVVAGPQGVMVYFAQGAKLEDPHNALQGDGDMARFLLIDDETMIERLNLYDYVARAYAQLGQ